MLKVQQCTTVAKAAERLKVDRSTVLRMVESGRLPHVTKLPGKTGTYLLDPADVDALAAERAS